MTQAQTKQYTYLLQQAENTTSRKEAIHLIRMAEKIRTKEVNQ